MEPHIRKKTNGQIDWEECLKLQERTCEDLQGQTDTNRTNSSMCRQELSLIAS